MPQKQIVNPLPPQPGAILSPAVRFGNLVFTAGMVGVGADGKLAPTLQEQAKLTLDNLKAALEAAGTSLDNVLKVTGFLANLDDRPAFNEVYKAYFPTDPPARTCIQGGYLGDGVLLEVECVACIPD